MRPSLLICNPKSGGKAWQQRLTAITGHLHEGGFEVTVRNTEGPQHATELARTAAEAGGYEVVFGLGGDGTLREIAVALMGSPIALGLLPGGTTNVLSITLGIPRQPIAASRSYRATPDLHTADLDVGLCGEIPFLMMVSAGVDSSILAATPQRAKQRWGKLAVARRVVGSLRDYSYPRFTLEGAGRSVEGSFAVVSNIPHYGGTYRITPEADPTDGRLDLGVFRGTGPAATLSFAFDTALGVHARRPDVELWRAPSATLSGPREARIQIDGDPLTVELPLELKISPQKLRVLLPGRPES
jgi:YegS/Rv2252/BmrU family lipid kinase